MKSGVVTGASSGIGLKICEKLVNMGFKVYGFARDFSKTQYDNKNFIKINCDITKTNELIEKVKKINKEEIYILVNNAGVGFFGPHEELNPAKIHSMVATNLEAPLILTNILLRDIKKSQGFIINISSITAKK